MINLTEITWDGEDRTIPGYGEARKGKIICVPDDLAESFKAQGLVKKPKTVKKPDPIEEAE